MQKEDDFSPMVGQGDVEAATGLKSRFSRRTPMPVAAEAGISRVLISSDGTFMAEESQSVGERYWGRIERWIKVDVSPHTLAFEIPLPDPSGRGDFLAEITVIATVTDPATAAKKGLTRVRSYVEPALRMALAAVSLDDEQRASMPMAKLREDTRTRVLGNLANRPLAGLPDGLAAHVASVAVEFDQATSSHLALLAEQARLAERVDAEAVVDAKRTGHEITSRTTWRDAIGDRLSDPQQRLIELAISDPTRENIAQVIDQANALEASHRDSFVHLLTLMIEKDYVERDDPLYNAAVSLLHSLQSQAKIPMLGSTERPRLAIASDDIEGKEDADWKLREVE